MNALDELKHLGAEVNAAIEQVEAEQTEGGSPEPTQYSSSVSSVSVDPDTGNIAISLTLYPGDQPVNPVPTPEEQITGAVTDTLAPGEAPPGQVAAQ